MRKGALLLSFALTRSLGFEAHYFSASNYFCNLDSDLGQKYNIAFFYTDLILPRIVGDSIMLCWRQFLPNQNMIINSQA